MSELKIYGLANKKMWIILILEILRKHSDADHRLTQQKIIDLLESEYGVQGCDRRTVRANVEFLRNLNYDIESDGGYYLAGGIFDEAELRMLIDSVLSSRTINNRQAKELIRKLEDLGSNYFVNKVSHVHAAENSIRPDNRQILYTISAINDAIDANKKVQFQYLSYGTDLKMHSGEKIYKVSPYQMIASNGWYYLLCNLDGFDDVSYYRIDKITELSILTEKRKPQKQVKGLENGLDLPKHLAEHAYMFCGESAPVRLRCRSYFIGTVIDWFGKDVKIVSQDKDSDEIVVRVVTNLNAMFYWALQYGAAVEVLEPASLRDELREELGKMYAKYQG